MHDQVFQLCLSHLSAKVAALVAANFHDPKPAIASLAEQQLESSFPRKTKQAKELQMGSSLVAVAFTDTVTTDATLACRDVKFTMKVLRQITTQPFTGKQVFNTGSI